MVAADLNDEPPPTAEAVMPAVAAAVAAPTSSIDNKPITKKTDSPGGESPSAAEVATPAVTLTAATSAPTLCSHDTPLSMKADRLGNEPPSVAEAAAPIVTSATTASTSVLGGDSWDYDPKIIARYVQYHRTGIDPDHPPEADGGAVVAPAQTKKRKKDIPPAVHEARGIVQRCCHDHDLPRALDTFHGALRKLIRLEAPTFYQLLNLCEGIFAESQRAGRAHVGTPKYFKGGGRTRARAGVPKRRARTHKAVRRRRRTRRTEIADR